MGVGDNGMAHRVKRNPCLTISLVATILILAVALLVTIFLIYRPYFWAREVLAPVEVAQKDTLAHCWGAELSENKMTAAWDMCVKGYRTLNKCTNDVPVDPYRGEQLKAQECFLKEIGWVNDDWDVDRKKIKEDLEKSALSERIKPMEKRCAKEDEKDGPDEYQYFRCSLFAFNMACTERLSQILETFPSAGGMQWKEGWEKSGVIGDKVKEIPMAEATVAFNGWNVKPGEWIKTEMMTEKPMVSWPADPAAYYTLIVEDNGINNTDDDTKSFFTHYLVSNIKGTDISTGTVDMDWIPSFAFQYDGSELVTNDDTFFHPHVYLVYKQKDGKTIKITEKQTGCTTDLGSARQQTNHDKLAEDYGLIGPVAGNVLLVPYSEGTNAQLCYFTKCTESPFPADLAGINDMDQCKKSS